jgi:PPOX class probable F420-dependent enzyme
VATSKIPENARAFLEQPRLCVMGTINADGSPQLTVMWYDLVEDVVILNTSRGLIKEKNLRRDARMSICVEDGPRFVTLNGRGEIVEDRAIQEAEVNRMAARYRGPRLGATHWQTIAHMDRLGIRMHVESVITRGL